MTQQKLTHTQIVRKSYTIASQLLGASISLSNIAAFDQELSQEDVERVQRQIEKIVKRLSRQAH
jgi:protein involved in ribonucleotide reduction